MEVLHDKAAVVKFKQQLLNQSSILGFVPTMGALHQGHISLIKKAKENGDTVLCSIFVNPTQFNDIKDFNKYPSTIDQDLEMLIAAGCDAVFVPTVQEMYPNGIKVEYSIELGSLGELLEAAFRPGHFDGVVQIVHDLLQTVQPQRLYLGMKDYQQVMVIKKLVETAGMPVEVIPCNTVREADGLAMSSRNVRLSSEGRKKAMFISKYLFEISQIAPGNDPELLTKSYIEKLNQLQDVFVEYFQVVDFQTLLPLSSWNEKGQNLAIAAVKVDDVRLIDNLLF